MWLDRRKQKQKLYNNKIIEIIRKLKIESVLFYSHLKAHLISIQK